MVVPPLDPPEALTALRRDMRTLRRRLGAEHDWQPAPLDAALLAQIQDRDIAGLYVPMGGEPDPTAIVLPFCHATALPALSPDGMIHFRRWSTGDPLTASPWGGVQPLDTADVVDPDVIFVPLVAFDSAMNRLGQGGGHYDRYFADHDSALRIGVAWEAQRVAALPVRSWDVPLHAVVTEQQCHFKDPRPCPTR
jgi:5-formyltetrahydrofolate cyclo-ligase